MASINISNTNNYISSLIGAGADAMTNLFYVEFSGGLVDKDSTLKTATTIRTSDIKLPTATHTTNTVNYMTTSLDVPIAGMSLDKKIDITLRLDSDYEIYKYLLAQQRLTSVPNLGFAATEAPDESTVTDATKKENGLTISVYAPPGKISEEFQAIDVTGNNRTTNGWQKMYEYKNCWLSSITPPTYSYSNASSLSVTASFYFYDYTDPQNNLLKN